MYAATEVMPQHARARAWLDARLSGTTAVGLPWHSLLGFVRLASSRRMLAEPLRIADAWRQVHTWLDSPVAWVPAPTERHRAVLDRLIVDHVTSSDLVMDAHLAALAIEHGLVLCSADQDFARFRGLRWENPL